MAQLFEGTHKRSPSREWDPYEDVINAPPGLVAEYVAESLRVTPRPPPSHGTVCFNLAMRIAAPYESGKEIGGWKFHPEPKLKLSQDVVIPDIAGWHLPWDFDDWSVRFVTQVPKWVCEIHSPITRQFDLDEKREIYADHGVEFIWFVDPSVKSVEAFTLMNGDWQAAGSASGENELSLPPFSLVSFPLNELWK